MGVLTYMLKITCFLIYAGSGPLVIKFEVNY